MAQPHKATFVQVCESIVWIHRYGCITHWTQPAWRDLHSVDGWHHQGRETSYGLGTLVTAMRDMLCSATGDCSQVHRKKVLKAHDLAALISSLKLQHQLSNQLPAPYYSTQ